MYSRILVPVDGSALAEAALGLLPLLPRGADPEILLVRAEDLPPLFFTSPRDRGYRYDPVLMAAREYLARLSESLSSRRIRNRVLVEIGPPGKAILGAAAREGASLIAMSTHARVGWNRAFFGSVAEGVMCASAVPVLAAREFMPRHGGLVRTVLAPVDGSDRALAILPHLLALGRDGGAHIVLLHAIDREEEGCDTPRALEQLRALGDGLAGSGVHVSTLAREGDPVELIDEFAETCSADLIAMTTHGRTGARGLPLGSVTEGVLRGTKVPVFVMRGRKAWEVQLPKDVESEFVHHA